MRKFIKNFICILCLVAVLVPASMLVFADGAKQGWHTDSDGKERYYENGSYVTGIREIAGIPFEFAADGASLGVYDGYKAPGTAGTMDTANYKAEVEKNKILYFCDYNSGMKFGDKTAINGSTFTSSLRIPNGSKPYQHVVLKNGVAVFGAKGANSVADNLALRVINAVKETNLTSYDSYIDFNFNPTQKDIVFEAEYKLGEDFNLSNTIPFLNCIDRSSSSSALFISLLRINQEGYVIASAADELLCKLSKDVFTRISVSLDRTNNKYSVYVNGVLVKKDLTFYTAGAVDHKTIAIEQFRTFQFNGSKMNQGSFYIDNAYIYEASKPVCTEIDASPKNGVCVDGGYLRYYKDNVIITGKRIVNGTYLGVTLVDEFLNFNSLTGKASVGAEVVVKVDGKVTSTFLADNNEFTAPAAVDIAGKKFVGWKVTDSSGASKFARVGENVKVSSSVTCEAVGIEFALLNGASVKITEGGASLRFMAKASLADSTALTDLGVISEVHMLLVPTEYLDNTFGYVTAEALKKSGYTDFADVTVSDEFKRTENYSYLAASTANITAYDYLKEYSAIAYLKLMFADGTSIDVYADYDAENNSRCVYEVAEKAYNDRITESGYDSYANKIKANGGNTYSPYTKSQLNVIKDYVDKVISLESSESGVVASGMFYEAPYKVSQSSVDKGYDVTVKSSEIAETVGVILNGKLLASSEYQMAGDSCTLTVESGKVALGITSDSEEVNEWLMLDAGSSKTVFGKSVAFPEEAPNGAEKGFYWSYAENKSPALTSGDMGEYYKDRGVYDMTDWKALSFYIYVDEEYKGATFYFIFYSENEETSGTDYYARQIKVSEAGWTKITLNKSDFSANRSPLGWDKITSVSWPTTGWSMANLADTELYLTSITFYDTEFASGAVDLSEIEDAAVFAVGGYASMINGVKYYANPEDPTAVAFEENGVYYVPASCLAASMDNDAFYYSASNKVMCEYDGAKFVFGEGSYYTKNGEKVKLQHPAKLNGEAVFISVEDAMVIFDYNQKYIDRMGLVALWYSESSDPIFDSSSDHENIFAIMQECIYQRPTGEQIVSDLNAYSGGQHPYLMLNEQDFKKLAYYKEMDATLQGYIEKLDKSFGINSSKFKSAVQYFRLTDGQRLLSISRDVMDKLIAWSLLYRLGDYDEAGKAAILNRICKELDAVCNFYDESNKKYSWHPEHFLDTAEMAFGVALAYDWLYDLLTTEQKAQVEKAIYELALKQTSALGGTYNLGGATNNWNGVCNGGIMTAALAIANVEAYQKDVITVLSTSILAVEKGMWVYAPDGGYEEGPGYWGYGTTYLHGFMSALDKACGTNYGLFASPGFATSAYFTTYLGNANTTWGFHDGGSGDTNPEVAAWFALKLRDGNLNAIRRNGINNGWTSVSSFDIMYFDPHIINNSISLTLDAYYSLDAIMTFRSSWDTSGNIFAGLHGGDNAASHGDLDIGNFVVNVNGTFMIGEMGSENYNVHAYFGANRWSYYRKRAEGQNTLVMLPSGQSWNGKTGAPQILQGTQVISGSKTPTPDQVAGAVSKMLRYESGTNSALGVVDTKPAHNASGLVNEMQRGLWMKDNRSVVVIQDEGSFKSEMDIWWFAHTQGTITVSEDGKSAYIYRNGIYLYAEIVTDISNAKFTVMKAESLDPEYVGDMVDSGMYGSETESSRAGFTKLCITAKKVTDYNLAVVFKVISDPADVPELGTTYSWTDIKDWKVD